MGAQWKQKGREAAANAKGRVMTRLSRELMIAARDGADPAMNPRLRVLLIRNASLLDRESMRQVAVLAKEAGAQLWVERVEVDDQTTVLIEDGQVAGGASVPPVAAAG